MEKKSDSTGNDVSWEVCTLDELLKELTIWLKGNCVDHSMWSFVSGKVTDQIKYGGKSLFT